jgi:hypothetical protein
MVERRLAQLERKVRNIRGPGVTHTPEGIAIRPVAAAQPASRRSKQSTFPVLVKWSAGSDGTSTTYATWTYNLYRLSDTAYTNALTDAAVQPTCGRCRSIKASVTKATDGSVGLAYIAADGTVALFDCPELYATTACT